MDRTAFFAYLRQRNSGLFGTSLSQGQVDGVEAVLDECHRVGCDLGQTAYVLATAYGETGGKMQPRRENMNYSAKRLTQVWPTRFPSLSAAKPYAGNPRGLANRVYNGRMGNRTGTDDGWNFRGSGIGQITGRNNYAKWAAKLGVDTESLPEKLMTMPFSVKALVRPMMEGWATGRNLPEFVKGNKREYLAARMTWGGVEAEKYAAYAKTFQAALEAGGFSVVPPHRPDVEPTPAPSSGLYGFIPALLAALAAIFKRKST